MIYQQHENASNRYSYYKNEFILIQVITVSNTVLKNNLNFCKRLSLQLYKDNSQSMKKKKHSNKQKQE